MALDNNHVTKLGELKQLIDGLWGKVTTAISNAVSGLLSKSEAAETYATKGEIPTVPTNVSAFENDSGYITSETDPVFSASAAAGITYDDIGRWNTKEVVYITTANTTYNDVMAIINADRLPVLVYPYQVQSRTYVKHLYPDYFRNDRYSNGAINFTSISDSAFVPDSAQTEIIVDGGMLFCASINYNNQWTITKKSFLVSNGKPQFPAGDETNPIFFNPRGEPTPTNWEFHWQPSNKTFNVSALPLSRCYLFFNTNSSSNSSITINNDTVKDVVVTNLGKSGTASTTTIKSLASSAFGAIKKCGGMGLIIRQNETSLIVIREI